VTLPIVDSLLYCQRRHLTLRPVVVNATGIPVEHKARRAAQDPEAQHLEAKDPTLSPVPVRGLRWRALAAQRPGTGAGARGANGASGKRSTDVGAAAVSAAAARYAPKNEAATVSAATIATTWVILIARSRTELAEMTGGAETRSVARLSVGLGGKARARAEGR
jgi:hypothetical protein